MLSSFKLKNKIASAQHVRDAFKNADGAIDLASIMVGIIVIGIIGGVVAATVFAVIPWAQDNRAKSNISSVRTAESAYRGFMAEQGSPLYGTTEQLSAVTTPDGKTVSLLPKDSSDVLSVYTSTNAKGESCYVVESKSASGAIFYGSSETPEVSTDSSIVAQCLPIAI